MSNLIKSGKVIDIGVPVNVGLSYKFHDNEKLTNDLIKPINVIKENKQNIGLANKNLSALSRDEIADKYLEEAKMKADEYYENEVRRAYEEGIKKAEEEAAKIIEQAKIERESILESIVELKENAIKEYKDEVKNMEKDVLELSLSIAEKIINYEVDRSDNYVLGIVKDSLDKIMSKKDVILKLSTADYYTVLSNKKYLVANVRGFGEIDIVQDESMEPGSCIVDTPLGVIDGGIQVRMDNIQKEVKRIINE